jgi:DNA-binding SARP family transcriptional activator
VRNIPGHRLSDHQAQGLREAIGLYRGDLMETADHDWCAYDRDRLQLTYLAMLEQLMDYCAADRLFTEGMRHGQTILRYDPARETTHRRLMRLSYTAGDRTSAIRQYERCATVMAEEFGVRPSAQTMALYEEIRADRVADLPEDTVTERKPAIPAAAEAFANLQLRLDQIQASLAALQDAVMHGQENVLHGGQKRYAS